MGKAAKADNGKNENILRIYFNQIKAYPLLNFDEELALSRLIRQGNQQALHKLIQANLRLVVKIARSYSVFDVPFMDLIQEGNMGLMHAAEKYDYAKNVRFSTYAGWWIRQFIGRYLLNRRRIVKLPQHKEEILRKIQYVYHTLSQTLMRKPRSEDIAAELGFPVEDINFIINMSSGPLPLEWDITHDSSVTAVEIHEDYTYCPEQNFFRQYYREGARRFLDRLKDRERQVLNYRYQLEGGKPHTLTEIAGRLNIVPETVRQIELKALQKIRSHAAELKRYGLLEAI